MKLIIVLMLMFCVCRVLSFCFGLKVVCWMWMVMGLIFGDGGEEGDFVVVL